MFEYYVAGVVTVIRILECLNVLLLEKALLFDTKSSMFAITVYDTVVVTLFAIILRNRYFIAVLRDSSLFSS